MTRPPRPFPFLPLFVPADRPERYAKAAASGADAVFIDLEDAVAPAAKTDARQALVGGAGEVVGTGVPVFVRVNAVGTPWHEDDIAALRHLGLAGIVLPKAERPADIERLAGEIGEGAEIIALIESPLGLANARGLAAVADCLAFGSIDFALSLGAEHRREALLAARSELVLASVLAGKPGPIDGVTTAIGDAGIVADDAAYAASLGFAGKLLIHPKQIAPAIQGFRPKESDIAWAERVLTASGGEAVALDGAMIDAPELARARRIRQRAERDA